MSRIFSPVCSYPIFPDNDEVTDEMIFRRFSSFYDTFPSHSFEHTADPFTGSKREVCIYQMTHGAGPLPFEQVQEYLSEECYQLGTLFHLAPFLESIYYRERARLTIFAPATRIILSSGAVSIPYFQNLGSMHPDLLGEKGKLHIGGEKQRLQLGSCIVAFRAKS